MNQMAGGGCSLSQVSHAAGLAFSRLKQITAGGCRQFVILCRRQMYCTRMVLVDAASLNPLIFMDHDVL
jgi:hypothetical protein